jgi:formylmethanofuran dehydrogenase subunit D
MRVEIMEMILNTIRMIDNDQVKEFFFGDENSLKEKLAIGLINPKDFKNLNLNSKYNLRLTNNYGNVVIKPIEDEDVPLGTILMPVSIWANQITGIEQKELIYKNIDTEVERTEDNILNLNDLINLMRD